MSFTEFHVIPTKCYLYFFMCLRSTLPRLIPSGYEGISICKCTHFFTCIPWLQFCDLIYILMHVEIFQHISTWGQPFLPNHRQYSPTHLHWTFMKVPRTNLLHKVTLAHHLLPICQDSLLRHPMLLSQEDHKPNLDTSSSTTIPNGV